MNAGLVVILAWGAASLAAIVIYASWARWESRRDVVEVDQWRRYRGVMDLRDRHPVGRYVTYRKTTTKPAPLPKPAPPKKVKQ